MPQAAAGLKPSAETNAKVEEGEALLTESQARSLEKPDPRFEGTSVSRPGLQRGDGPAPENATPPPET